MSPHRAQCGPQTWCVAGLGELPTLLHPLSCPAPAGSGGSFLRPSLSSMKAGHCLVRVLELGTGFSSQLVLDFCWIWGQILE